MVMRIRYASAGVEIAAVVPALIQLRHTIESFSEFKNSRKITITAERNYDPYPYNRVIHRLSIEKGRGSVKVSLVQNELCIVGAAENLERLASFFSFTEEDVFPAHFHYEFYPGNPYISSDSIPLYICVQSQFE